MKAFTKPQKVPFRFGKLEFQDPILLCVLLYVLLLRDYSGFLRLSLLASFGHEWGHILVYRLLCGTFPQIRVSATGVTMKTQGVFLSCGQVALLAVAGPAANFLLAAVTFAFLQQCFTLLRAAFFSANILLACFNLLPIPPLDGAVLFRFFLQSRRYKLQFRVK